MLLFSYYSLYYHSVDTSNNSAVIGGVIGIIIAILVTMIVIIILPILFVSMRKRKHNKEIDLE